MMRNRSDKNSPTRISSTSQNKISLLQKTLAALLALIVWHLLSVLVGTKLLLVSPVDVLIRLTELVPQKAFFSSVVFSFSRIAVGFFAGYVLGVLLAVLASRSHLFETLLWPYMLTVKTVPVASFIVLALIWLKSSVLAGFISFLMVLPISYTNILQGIRCADNSLLEMASVFDMRLSNRIRCIYLPAVKPFLMSSVKIAVGLAWKSGIAAELIGIPNGSIGEHLYDSKLYFDTASLFSWTLVIVILSVCFEKLLLLVISKTVKGADGK